MIIIVSSITDFSTQKVIEWLNNYKVDFVIINKDNPITNFNISSEQADAEIEIGNKKINIKNVKSFWYRREEVSIKEKVLPKVYPIIFLDSFQNFINFENLKLKEYLSYILKSKSFINNEADSNINKLVVLDRAKKVGLNIPNTCITTSPMDKSDNTKYIIKPIGETVNFYYQNAMCRLFTHQYDSKKFTANFPTLIQSMVSKLFEIRAFYLKGKFYCIAIFSQQNAQTKVDYRNYNFIKSNRSVPFNLPKQITSKCKQLMKSLNLKSGSIDLIYSKQKEFIFLEVNPIGQFDNVSITGNYNLENKIANILINGRD